MITFQLGKVAPEVSIVYRFALASALLFAWAAAKRLPLAFEVGAHGFFALQGSLLFCLNYVLFYYAQTHIASGLVALICSGISVGNIAGMRLLYGQPVSARVLLGSLAGILGIALVCWPELAKLDPTGGTRAGVLLAAIATLSASGGNLATVAMRRRRLPVLQSTAWAMGYGSALSAVFALASGTSFTFDPRLPYMASMAYLVVFGSVVAFMSYLTLLDRVGADRAAYVNVTVPVLALLLSALMEGFHWRALTYAGVALCVFGNVLVIRKPAAQ